ncbi:MAG: lasso peptide biosynthesis PqqD family chaperone [Deltaproteobacteria bacterium]|nr:lasso peptide biosynthesis PqqD family chaperone [Deltaproteobacteria bacterium]
MNGKVDLSTVVVQSEGILATDIEGEVVMMSIEHGTYSGLDVIGSEIWGLLESPRRVSEICGIMRGRYNVEQKQCEEDILTYLNDLASDNTITVINAAG